VRHSLRSRALLLVFLFNSAVFAALGVILARSQAASARHAEELWTEDLVATIRNTLAPEGLKVAAILRWPSWRFFDDAVLVDGNLSISPFTGKVSALGIDLNPVGVAHRPPDFTRPQALAAIHAAMRAGQPVRALGGRAVPIQGRRGTWGGLWYRAAGQEVDYGALIARVLPWFALSTLLLTGSTFLAMRVLVLDPVAQLAEGARRVRAGDFAVHLRDPQRRDELAELVRAFNDMTGTIASFNQRLSAEVRAATEKARAAEAAAMRERRLAAMGELAAGLAHEINNPLGGMQNAVADLERGELSSERRAQYLGLLARGLARIGETVNRLRRFVPREAPFDTLELADIVQDALELVRHRAERLGVALDFRIEGEVRAVAGNRNDIGQAVLNLVGNALDSLEEGGTRDGRGPRIEVRLSAAPSGPVLSVQDNGPGVDPALLERIGDPFYTTKEVGRGTGLGLALVHGTMRAHGGELALASEPERFFRAELRFRSGGQPPLREGDPA
jgi:signal transduction histidine kinase